jgi:hypothetical protein
MGSEPMFWANINNHRAVIWPKGGKDLSAVKMKFDIINSESGTLLSGKTLHSNFITIPTWLLAVSVFCYLLGFVGAMFLFLTANEYFVSVFSTALFFFGIFFVGLMQRVSEGQEEQLRKFILDVFKNNIKNTKFS